MERPAENLRSGERRFVTVLFADMKDFSALSQRMDPEEMDALMTEVFSGFESIVHGYDGSVEKYIGDAMVAVFGAPAIHEDDPARTVNAALDFQEEIERLNARLASRSIHLEFRMGVNTGLITTGRRGQYEVVTGHAMTVASRLESVARTNSVLVSETTHEHCAGEFAFGEPVTLHVKGQEAGLRAYPVRGRVSQPKGDDAIFVARESILDEITRRYLRHEPARTDGVILTGEAGTGKTRTALRFVEQIQQFPNHSSPVLFTRAQRYRTRPFAVVSDALAGYFGLDAEAEEGRVLEAVTSGLKVEQKTAETFAQLFSGDQRNLDSQAFVVLYLVLKSIIAANIGSPFSVILVIDNLRFVDRQSRDFFRFFLKNADVKPFFVLTDRHPDPADTEVFSGLATITIPTLSRSETRELIRQLWPDAPDDGVIRTIQDSAQGNPLFVREYVRFARERPEDQALPTTIQTIFLTSIDSLPSPKRDLLKRVSVFALNFSADDARYLQGRTEGDPTIVDAALEEFVYDGTLVRTGELYTFRNDVFKQALYDSLLNYNKRVLHRVIAELMRSNGNPHPLRLLHHLTRAGDFDAAHEALFDSSPQLVTNLEYMRYVDRILEHTPRDDHDSYIKLLFVKAALLFNNGNSEEADTLLKDILRIAIGRQSTAFAASAYHLVTAYNLKSYSFDKVAYTGRKSLAYYRDDGEYSLRRQNVLEMIASAAFLRNDTDGAEQALAEIERLVVSGKSDVTERLQQARAKGCLMRGEYGRARALLRDLESKTADGQEFRHQRLILSSLANYHLCDWHELLRIGEAIVAARPKHAANLSQVNAHIAVATHATGRTGAEGYLQQAEFNASQIRNDFDAVDAQRTFAECCLIMGRDEQAERIAAEAAAIGLRHSATYPVFTLLMLLVEIWYQRAQEQPVHFYLTEAGFLLERGYLVRSRDAMLYHYFRWKTDPRDTAARESAQAHLTTELDRIGDPALARAFLATRHYNRVATELQVTVPA